MEWDIKNLDCSKMLINPQSPKLVSFFEENMPHIKNIEVEYKNKVFTKSMVFRYILLMYDPNSEVQKRHSLSWYAKKYESCGLVGFPIKKGKDGHPRFSKEVDEMILGKNSGINDIITAFLGWTNNVKWNYLVFLQESMLNFTRDAMGGKQTDVKTSKEYRELYDKFHQLSNEIGHTYEETEEFVSRFYYNIEQSRLAIRPEDYAEAIKNGDDFRSDSPYLVDYKVDEIKFIGDDEDSLSI